jgi:hypothetical protein
MFAPASTAVLLFADGHWQEAPQRFQTDQPYCLGIDGKVVAGKETATSAKSLEPQADGTLRAMLTITVLTNECGNEGMVVQKPAVVNRTGDRPTGVSVADPAAVDASPSASSPPPPAAGPVLNGAYRFDFDNAHQTADGKPTTGDGGKETQWRAFRSLCTPTRCVATGVALSDNNQQEAAENPDVAQFIDGNWETTPRLMDPHPCDAGNGTKTTTQNWSIQPQADGTLRGVATITVLTSECAHTGKVYKTPIVVTRIGDVPPAVVLADPALF